MTIASREVTSVRRMLRRAVGLAAGMIDEGEGNGTMGRAGGVLELLRKTVPRDDGVEGETRKRVKVVEAMGEGAETRSKACWEVSRM